jgi:hypothetical protein
MTLAELTEAAKGNAAREAGLLKFSKRLKRLCDDLALLDSEFAEFLEPSGAKASQPPPVKKPRAPIAVTQEATKAILEVLIAYPTTYLTISAIKEDLVVPFNELSARMIGAGLRHLVKEGMAVEEKGKWKLAP